MNGLAQPFSDEDRYKVARLGTLRIWRLKQKLVDARILVEAAEKV